MTRDTVRLGNKSILPVILAGLFITMLYWSWRKWTDILVDFGRELYVPWQISSGKVLYRDIAHVFGPASQYFNALLFKVFGASYTVLIAANSILLALFLAFLYCYLCKISSRVAAFAGCAVIITVFAFSQYLFTGNFNYISPYSHEAAHGIYLSLLMICFLTQFGLKQHGCHLFWGGLVTGVLFLTKTEIFLAATITVALFFLLLWRKIGFNHKSVRHPGVFILSALVPPLAFMVYFMTEMPLHDAVRAVLANWMVLLNSGISGNMYYKVGMGLDNISLNMQRMLIGSLVVILPVSVSLLFASAKCRRRDSIRYICAACFCIVTYFLDIPFLSRSLPVVVAAVFVVLFVSYFKASTVEEGQRILPPLLLASLSFCLLGKMILNCSISSYGVFLALPSAVLLVVVLVWYFPEWLDKKGRNGKSFRTAALIVLALLSMRCVYVSYVLIYGQKGWNFGKGADRIVTFNPSMDPRVSVTAEAVDWLSSHLRDDETFVALPEGIMLNYLLRRKTLSRYTNFMMPEIMAFGEGNILNDLMKYPPDYVVVVHKDTSEFGVDFFGKDSRYGKSIKTWVKTNYYQVRLFGNEPLVDERFGIKIMKSRRADEH